MFLPNEIYTSRRPVYIGQLDSMGNRCADWLFWASSKLLGFWLVNWLRFKMNSHTSYNNMNDNV